MERDGRAHQVLHLPRRGPNSLHSPLSNTLIPRDFLTRVQDPQATGAAILQITPPTAFQSTPLPDDEIPSPNLLCSDMPSIANPCSPRPLHFADTSDKSLHERRDSNVTSNKKSGAVKKEGVKRTHPEDSNNGKNVSSQRVSVNVTKQPNLSPPATPKSTTSMAKDEHKIDRAAPPRNSSIDSAISSISSSAENSHKSSIDSANAESPEIKHLIAAAGSAENLISHLLKDKQHAASQNAQLWKLVDKQRSLLMGLNQDLERSIRDKEKYRKKLKDLQAQAPVPPHFDSGRLEQPQSTVENAEHGPQAPGREHPTEPTFASSCTPNNKSANSLNSSPLDPAMMPSPLHLLQSQPKHQNTNALQTSEAKAIQQMPKPAPDHDSNNLQAVPKEQQSLSEVTHQGAQASFLASPSPTQARAISQNAVLTSMPMEARQAPVQIAESRAERPEKTHPPTRKPPPAPLNLNQAKSKSALLQDFAPLGPSGPEHDGSQKAQEIALDRRGRRKTREEDDRNREAAAKEEAAARSRSSKSSKSGKKKSKQDTNADATTKVAPTLPPSVLPTAPRPVAVTPPSEAALGGPSPLTSIAAVLSPDSLRAAPVVERTLVVPPMSPGLPVSPRPADRPLGSPMPRLPRDGSGIISSPQMSPPGVVSGLPLSPRPPRSAVPAPLGSLAVSSPPPSQAAFPHPGSPRNQEMPRLTQTTNVVHEEVDNKESPVSPFHGVHIDRGLVDPTYPDLLLPPKALASIMIGVSSSRLRPKRQSYMVHKSYDEDPVITLSIFSRSGGRELWRIEKVIMALPQLDLQMRTVSNISPKLPERKLFSGHSPAIVDARRNALNQYFGELLEAATEERSALVLCQFLSNDVIEARDDETSLLTPSQRNKPVLALGSEGRPVKEGYLTKRGKNFGGWKVRYFILQGNELKYFESPAGTHLGTIKLQGAQIGKQTQSPSPSRTDDDVENQYRHAFLLLEPKRKDSSSLVRHVLCAESDEERDEWVLVLMQHCDQSEDEQNKQQGSRRAEDGRNHVTGLEATGKPYPDSHDAPAHDEQTNPRAGTDAVKVGGHEQETAGPGPTAVVQQIDRRQDVTPSPTSTSSATNTLPETNSAQDQHAASLSSKTISGPKNGGIIQDAGSWGNKPLPQTNGKDKKRSMWGFRPRGGSESVQSTQPADNGGTLAFSQSHNGPARAVFGLPLAEAVELCPPRGVDVSLPAVVYRCIEYLRAKDAASEEGIFRLSGSNIVIKALRERFNTEGDVNFVADDQYYDVHAVASLFKSYLRELPTTVLTKELHLDFLHVLELDERSKKIAAFNVLVHRLPPVNLALLRALSKYLIEIVDNADKNKMNVRNMGIVFSPTLNIPAPVFAMFLTEFDAIFGAEPAAMAPIPEHSTQTVELSVPNQLTAEDIRSPRHQMFSDLPTPAYNQTTFPEGPPPGQFPMQQSSVNPKLPSNANVLHNTGFVPMQPSYESKTYVSDPQAPTRPQQRYSTVPQLAPRAEYGSMNMMMAPSNAATVKAKRRESSMLFMGMSQGKSSVSKMRDDTVTSLVPDNSFE